MITIVEYSNGKFHVEKDENDILTFLRKDNLTWVSEANKYNLVTLFASKKIAYRAARYEKDKTAGMLVVNRFPTNL